MARATVSTGSHISVYDRFRVMRSPTREITRTTSEVQYKTVNCGRIEGEIEATVPKITIADETVRRNINRSVNDDFMG